jgi:hypothetical protein
MNPAGPLKRSQSEMLHYLRIILYLYYQLYRRIRRKRGKKNSSLFDSRPMDVEW